MYIKARLSGSKVSVSSTIFMYLSLYLLCNVEGWGTTLFHTYIILLAVFCVNLPC